MLVGIIIGAVASGILVYLSLKQQLKKHAALNQEIQQQNEQIEIDNKILLNQKNELEDSIKNYYQTIKHHEDTIQLYGKHIEDQKTTLDNLSKTIEEKNNSIKIIFDKAKQDCEKEYLIVLKDWMNDYHKKIDKYQKETKAYEKAIEHYKIKQAAIVESLKREQEKKDKEKYYKVNIDSDSEKDICLLRDMSKQLQNKEILNKVIWKSYFEKPTNDLIGRLIGDKVVTGIYKITNTIEHKAYIGQAVDIAARFKQHIKRGLGAETPLKNKLYPALAEFGVENFTFEIVEECDRKDLNEKEKFWIDYYNTKSYGYNVTGGGS